MKLDEPWKYVAEIPQDLLLKLDAIVDYWDWTQHPSPEPGHTSTAQIECLLGPQTNMKLGTVSELLTEQMQPAFEWGRQFYPGCVPYKAYIGALRANSHIYLHIDPGRHHSLAHRQHLVIRSPDGSEHLSWTDDWVESRTQMLRGTSWEIDNIRYHAGHNLHHELWRWHAIIDWLPQEVLDNKGHEWLAGRDVDKLARVYRAQLKARTTPSLKAYRDDATWEKVRFVEAFVHQY